MKSEGFKEAWTGCGKKSHRAEGEGMREYELVFYTELLVESKSRND
jgi:hypothetical protein